MAQEVALRYVASGKLRRLPAKKKSCKFTDVQIGDAALFCEATNRKSAPRWRGPAKISDIDPTGASVKFQRNEMHAGEEKGDTTSCRRAPGDGPQITPAPDSP